jgi:hypothetical protein
VKHTKEGRNEEKPQDSKERKEDKKCRVGRRMKDQIRGNRETNVKGNGRRYN